MCGGSIVGDDDRDVKVSADGSIAIVSLSSGIG